MTSSIIVAGLAAMMLVLLFIVMQTRREERREDANELPTPQITPKLAEFKSKLDELEAAMAALTASAEQASAERGRRGDPGPGDSDPSAQLSNEALGETLVPRRLENRVRRKEALIRRLAARKSGDELYGELRRRWVSLMDAAALERDWSHSTAPRTFYVKSDFADLYGHFDLSSVWRVRVYHAPTVLYFSGHGTVERPHTYIATRAAEIGAKTRTPSHTHPEMVDTVTQWWQAFDDIQALQQAVETDACA